MKLAFILSLLFFPIIGVKAQEINENNLRSFINTVAANSLTNDEIITKYICNDTGGMDKSLIDKNHQFISMQIDELRKKLLLSSVKELTITKYNDLPVSEKNIITTGASANTILILSQKHKKIITVLFKDDKIASFVTMNKGVGGKRVFIDFCSNAE